MIRLERNAGPSPILPFGKASRWLLTRHLHKDHAFDDERLKVEGLATRAALHWHIDRGMSVTVGVKEKWMIKENLSCPLDVPSPALAAPEKPLFTQMALIPGFAQYVAPGAGGCLRTGDNGHLYAAVSPERQLRVEQFSLTKKHLSVFSMLVPIIKELPPKART